MQIIIFCPYNHYYVQNLCASKIRIDKIHKKKITSIAFLYIKNINGFIYGFNHTLNKFIPLRFVLNLNQDNPIQLLFLGHGPFDSTNSNQITSDCGDFYSVTDIFKIILTAFGSIHRRSLHPTLNQICLFNCFSGFGYDIYTNRVMQLCEIMKNQNINCRIKGSLDSLFFSLQGDKSYFTGYSISKNHDQTAVFIKSLFECESSHITEKANLIGTVENQTIHYEERGFTHEIADPDNRIWQSYPIDMTNDYVILFKRTQYWCLKNILTYNGWGHEIPDADWLGKSMQIEKDKYYYGALDNFFEIFSDYIHNFKSKNPYFAEYSYKKLERIRELNSKNYVSFWPLHNQLIKILFIETQNYRNQLINDFAQDPILCETFSELNQTEQISPLLLSLPNRSYKTVWNWTNQLIQTDPIFCYMNSQNPNTISLEAYNPISENLQIFSVFVLIRMPSTFVENSVHYTCFIPHTVQTIDDIQMIIVKFLQTFNQMSFFI